MNPNVDWFFNKESRWKEAYEELRRICLGFGLKEELKWGCPCYTFQKNNVVLIHGFKEYCALLFHKGALLKDTQGLLIQQTENVQAARQMRFTSAKQIKELEPVIKDCIREAFEVERAGLRVELKRTSEFTMPAEFRKALGENARLKTAFEALTPGRQRGYLLYFSQAKQSKTRVSRIEKYYDHILNGKGLDD